MTCDSRLLFARATTLAVALAAVCAIGPAAAQSPNLLGSFRDWHAYAMGAGGDKVCYALSQPKDSDPKNVRRDPIFFLVSNWPARNVTGEPSVVPGYPYKDGGKVSVEIGADKFELFTKNEGSDGGAWLEDPAEEKRLLTAMKAGSTMVVKGTSSRGTLTSDHYSLLGITAALDKIDQACK